MEPVDRKEEYKYSTPIEGPDNQFGSAERSDDEDEKDTSLENNLNNNIHENSTKNRKHNKSYILDTTISNKVSKVVYEIIDKDDTHTNKSTVNRISLILSCTVYIMKLLQLDFVTYLF